MNQYVSVYLTQQERTRLEEFCDRQGLSLSAALRLVFRYAAGLPIPSRFRDELDQELERRRAVA